MNLKFRAWDLEYEKMVEVDIINLEDGKLDFIGDGITYFRKAKDIELMQSTGMTDNNGKEIFECDVVKLFDKDLYVVEWSSQEASYKLIPVDKRWSDCYFSNYENITKIIEVVGNIWEDGELLDS